MLFQSPIFWLFFAFICLLIWHLRSLRLRHWVLLLASYFFYAAWDIRYLSLILISTAIDFWCGQRIYNTETRKKLFLWISLLTNLGILGLFKYFNFFSESANALLQHFGIALSPVTLSVTLPVGISFYTFQSMSYTIDIYRMKLKPEPSFIRFALFVAFFPQLVAGPIVRASQFLPQLYRENNLNLKHIPSGLLLFSVGLFQKIVMADHLGTLVDRIFDTPEFYSRGMLTLGMIAYGFQIFCDFAGYSNMAIGVGRILGYRIPRNFKSPYAATNPQEFWKRWHISLSTWLKDYLYIPMGGSRGAGRLRTARNLMTTMVLGGLWHGANWTFVLWGTLHGLLLAIWHGFKKMKLSIPHAQIFSWAMTMTMVFLFWGCISFQ